MDKPDELWTEPKEGKEGKKKGGNLTIGSKRDPPKLSSPDSASNGPNLTSVTSPRGDIADPFEIATRTKSEKRAEKSPRKEREKSTSTDNEKSPRKEREKSTSTDNEKSEKSEKSTTTESEKSPNRTEKETEKSPKPTKDKEKSEKKKTKSEKKKKAKESANDDESPEDGPIPELPRLPPQNKTEAIQRLTEDFEFIVDYLNEGKLPSQREKDRAIECSQKLKDLIKKIEKLRNVLQQNVDKLRCKSAAHKDMMALLSKEDQTKHIYPFTLESFELHISFTQVLDHAFEEFGTCILEAETLLITYFHDKNLKVVKND